MWEINGWFWVCMAVTAFGIVGNLVLVFALINYQKYVFEVVSEMGERINYWRIAFSEVYGVTSNSDKKIMVKELEQLEKMAKNLIGEGNKK